MTSIAVKRFHSPLSLLVFAFRCLANIHCNIKYMSIILIEQGNHRLNCAGTDKDLANVWHFDVVSISFNYMEMEAH